MGQNLHEIRQHIEETRERIEDTVEALAYKTDIKARTKDAVDDGIDAMKTAVNSAIGIVRQGAEKATEQANEMMTTVTSKENIDAVRGNIETVRGNLDVVAHKAADQVGERMSQVSERVNERMNVAVQIARENPLGLALGSLVVGLIAGSMLPTSKIERDNIGELSGALTDGAKAKAGELIEQGKASVAQAVSETLSPLREESVRTVTPS
jgi:hypothetical protein